MIMQVFQGIIYVYLKIKIELPDKSEAIKTVWWMLEEQIH